LRDPFDVLGLVYEDDSLIAVELGRHFDRVADSIVLPISVGGKVGSAQ
jgi:hypothetical protein